MVDIQTHEISVSWSSNKWSGKFTNTPEPLDKLINDWLNKNSNSIAEIIDIKYHTQLTDNNTSSSALVIYKTKTPHSSNIITIR